MRWDAARVASRRQLPKPRKMMGPVGERMDTALVESAVENSRSGKRLNSVARGAPKPDPEAQAEPNPFAEAIDQKIKNITQSAELYLTLIDCGIDPSTLPGVEMKPRVCGSCDNTVGPGWNHCGDCLKRRRFGE